MKLFIGNTEMEMTGNEQIVSTIAANDIGDIKNRNGSFSNDFRLPATNRNKLALGNAHIVNSGTNKPYEKLEQRVEINGATAQKGYALLKSASDDFYNLAIFGANTDWFKDLREKKVTDLNLDDLNHTFIPANVRDARANNTTWDKGYNYPNVDYGNWTNISTNPPWYDFRPGLFAKFLFKRMLSESGYTPTDDFWNNDVLFSKVFVPFSARFIRDRKYENRDYVLAETTVDYQLQPSFSEFVYFDNILASHDYPMMHEITGKLIILDGCTLTLEFNLSITNADSLSQSPEFHILYYDANGNPAQYNLALPFNVLAGQTINHNETVVLQCSRTEVEFRFLQSSFPGSTGLLLHSGASLEIKGYAPFGTDDSELEVDPTFNYVTPAATLPDMKCIDFARTLWVQFCFMTDVDPQTMQLPLFTFADVLSNIVTADDWSNKIDLSVRPTVRFMLNKYGQSNLLRYMDDPEDPYLQEDPEYGKGYILVPDLNLPQEEIIFESEFALIKRMQSFSGAIRMAFIPMIDSSGDPIEPAPRIGLIEFDGLNTITMNGYPLEPVQPSIHGENLSFKNLVPVYYPTLTAMLQQAKIVKCLFRLTAVDIANFNFRKPKYVAHLNGYFWVNNIEQFCFTHKDSTMVELVRIG